MGGTYAAKTEVGADRSIGEIERTLLRYGATGFMYGRDEQVRAGLIAFRAHNRHIRIVTPLPDANDPEFTLSDSGRARSDKTAKAAYEQEIRRRWRVMALVIKAKLEAVESGVVDFETEFAPYVVLPSGQTAGEWLVPQIRRAYDTDTMPPLLPSVQKRAIDG